VALAIGQISITHILDGSHVHYQYASNTSETTSPTSGWTDAVPAPVSGYYVWQRIRTEYADGSAGDWSTPIRITGSKGNTGEKGDTGSAGTQGPPGPSGIPGYLGMYAEGDVLYLKGFAEDGTLTEDHGYLYIGKSRISVPEASWTITGENQGFVVFDDGVVLIAKMIPQSNYIQWCDYNDPTVNLDIGTSYLIGKFFKDANGINQIEMVPPILPNTFTKEHFMDILNERNEEEFKVWASALGVQQVFKSLAAWDIFADNLKVNHLEVTDGIPEGFRFIATRDGGEGSPVIKAEYNGEEKFSIDPKNGNVYIKGSGTFGGKIVNTVFETQEPVNADPIQVSTANTHWSVQDLYNSVGVIRNATGTFNGKALKQVGRVTNGKATLLSASTSGTGGAYVHLLTSPASGLTINYSMRADAYWHGGPSYDVNAGTKSRLHRNGSLVKEVVAYNASYNGDRITKTANGTRTSVAGEVYEGSVGKYNSGYTNYYGSISIEMVKTFAGDGMYIWYTDNSFEFLPKDSYQSVELDVWQSGVKKWDSNEHKIYRSGTSLFNQLSALPVGNEIFVSTEVGKTRSLTIGSESPFTDLVSITRSNNSVIFRLSGEYKTVQNDSYYTALALTATLLAAQSAVKADTIIPIRNLPDIGESGNRFGKLWLANGIDTQGTISSQILINSEHASNKVWGAVFN